MMTESSRSYWAGAEQGRLVLQRCGRCGRIRHYPQLLCDVCYSFDVEDVEASGSGTVHTWTVAHHAFHPSVASEIPYVLVTVDMDEGVRVLGRFRGGDDLHLGLPVRITFERGADGVPLPVFLPA
jgi:uncharacterized OB-fold protein